MDRIARSQMIFGYFIIFGNKVYMSYLYVFVREKNQKNMSRGMAVVKPWKGLQMPWKGLKKAWNGLNKAWKGLNKVWKGSPNQKMSFLGFCWVPCVESRNTQNDSDLQCSYSWGTVLKTRCSGSLNISLRMGWVLLEFIETIMNG